MRKIALVATLAFLAGCTAIWHLLGTCNDKIAFANIVVTFGAAVAGLAGLVLVAKQVELQTNQPKRHASCEILMEMNSLDFEKMEDEAIQESKAIKKRGGKAMITAVSNDRANKVKRLAAWYEDFAIGVRHGQYDEQVLFDSLQGSTKKIWDTIDWYVREVRDADDGDPRWYCEFEGLHKAWTNQMLFSRPGKKIRSEAQKGA